MSDKPLRLKREVATSPHSRSSTAKVSVDVWVDAGVYHLDSTFTYALPETLQATVHVGSFLLVPFNGREVTAVVLNINENGKESNLKLALKVLGHIPQLTPPLIELIELASRRYAAHPFDLIRSAIPSRVIGVEKEFEFRAIAVLPKKEESHRLYLQLPPSRSRTELIASKVAESRLNGGTLVVLPDSRSVEELSRELEARGLNHAVLDSSLGKSENYRNFLRVRTGEVNLLIGTRSSIFAPVAHLSTIIIYNEGSEHFYEQRSPGWNVRDIALLRNHSEGVNLTFIGYNPSTEISRLIDEGWIQYKRSREKIQVFAEISHHGELLPSRSLGRVKKALSKGPVLFLVPLKGYAQAIRCGKCRTISKCACGGSHIKSSSTAPVSCSHCLTPAFDWKCAWCESVVPALASRGIERHSHELGLMLPGVNIQVSTADHPFQGKIAEGIVLSTPSLSPLAVNGYSAVVILEADRFLSQPDMRAQERVREMFFAHAALASNKGEVIIVGDTSHPIISALTAWSPSPMIHHELEERSQLNLPPYTRVVTFTMESNEVIRFKAALLKAQEDGLIPSSTKILGPVPRGEKASLIISVNVSEGDSLVSTLHEFMRRRSIAKKTLPSMRIDPYSLSH
mgnify:CR=1 FL=1